MLRLAAIVVGLALSASVARGAGDPVRYEHDRLQRR
jgi:hypothetical protein